MHHHQPPPPPSPGNNSSPEWCRCGVCRPMPSDQENLCFKRVNCITRFQVFNNICLDRYILEVCIKARCDIRADDFNFSMESFRKAAYRQFILWRYGKLGRGNRRVVSSCAVLSIRHTYPSPDGKQLNFKAVVIAIRERVVESKGSHVMEFNVNKTTLLPSPSYYSLSWSSFQLSIETNFTITLVLVLLRFGVD